MRIEGSGSASFRVELANQSHDLEKGAAAINAAYKKVKYLMDGIPRVTAGELGEMISDPKKRVYFCISPEGDVCGSISMQLEDEKAELGLFSIHPDFQGKKIGPELLRQVENEAFKKAREIILKVIPLYQEPLIRFYERQGYQRTGKTEPFPEKDQIRYIRPECRGKVYFSILKKDSTSSS